jgi:hypothetical protein
VIYCALGLGPVHASGVSGIPAALEGEDDSVNIIKDHLPEVTAWRRGVVRFAGPINGSSHIKAVRFKHLPAAGRPAFGFLTGQKRCGVTGLLAPLLYMAEIKKDRI